MFSRPRIIVSILLGSIGSLLIWVVVPYNNFLLENSFISDTYLPVMGVVFMLALVLALNPLLRLLGPNWVLSRRQLALVFAIILAAAVLPSQGLLRMLPWSLARTTQQINHSPHLASTFEKTHVPHVLFPDKIGQDVPTPASDQLLDELNPHSNIPWANWAWLLPVWVPFLLSAWLLMVGVALVLFPEWRDTERLPFPLLDVYRSLLPEAGKGKLLPAMFRQRLFWIGAVGVMLIYAFNGLNLYAHNSVPQFPLGWHLSSVFTGVPWRYLVWQIKNVDHIYFVLIGIAFFMPNRVSFSIWSLTIGYGVYAMLARAYWPPYNFSMPTGQRLGAMIAVALIVLYLSRYHWRRVGVMMISRVTSDSDRLLKMSGWMVAVGAGGLFVWLLWTGVPYLMALMFVWIGFLISVLIARIVAESGLPFVRIMGFAPSYFMAMMPAAWLSGAAIYMAGFIYILFPLGSRISPAVLAAHAAGLDENASAKHQLRIGYLTIATLLVGLVVCGAVHLYMGYHHAVTLNGQFTQLNHWGSTRMRGAQIQLLHWAGGFWPTPTGRLPNLLIGVIFAVGLHVACMRMPRWPLHPIGLLLVGTYYGAVGWASIFIGWTLKVAITSIGGAGAYRRAKPLFLGLIMGEVFSAVIWTAVPVVLLWMGYNPANVGFMNILPT